MKVTIGVLLVLILAFLISSPIVFAESKSSILNDTGSWYVGEGLKKGNYFNYSICHIYYKDCTPFKIGFWVEKSEKVGNEYQWNLQVAISDGNKTSGGVINISKVTAEPIGSTNNLTPYADVFKSSLSWLSLYTQPPKSYESGRINMGPEKFNSKIWNGMDGTRNLDVIGKEQISTRGGDFNAYLLAYYVGTGKTSKIWVVDGFPFPVKADVYGISPYGPFQEYRFELLDHQKDVRWNPFSKLMEQTEQSSHDTSKIKKLDIREVKKAESKEVKVLTKSKGTLLPKTKQN